MTFDTVRKVNEFFRSATRADIDGILSRIVLSERQSKIFEMFYIRKQNINFIADTLYFSADTVSKELKQIRAKISKAL